MTKRERFYSNQFQKMVNFGSSDPLFQPEDL